MTHPLRSLARFSAAGVALSLLPALPAASHGLASGAALAGALHPLSGLDHLLLLVGLGTLAVREERLLLLPALLGAVVGALLGLQGWALPGQESLAALAVTALGALLLLRRRGARSGAGRALACAVVAAGSVVHALLHGQEAGADPSWWLGSGLAAAAVLTVVALLLQRCSARTIRQLGLLLCGGGLALAIAPLL